MQLHPACEELAFLVGTWKGPGEGSYPTIDSFAYLEEVSFAHVGKPFLAYTQKTRDQTTGDPLHAEAGYLRAVGPSKVELVLVQPSGIVELHDGTIEGRSISFELDQVCTTKTAKSVTNVVRSLQVLERGDQTILAYEMAMAAVGEPLTHHLRAELTRQIDS